MYLCSYCSYSGQWDHLKAHLGMLKSKKTRAKTQFEKELKHPGKDVDILNSIVENSKELKQYGEKEFLDILSKFKLPVRNIVGFVVSFLLFYKF